MYQIVKIVIIMHVLLSELSNSIESFAGDNMNLDPLAIKQS